MVTVVRGKMGTKIGPFGFDMSVSSAKKKNPRGKRGLTGLSVHHVPLERIDSSGGEGFDLVSESGEVAGKNRRHDLDR